MNKDLMFSSKNKEWETPDDLFKMLDMEFNFQVDLAASSENNKCKPFLGKESRGNDITKGGALVLDWYSLKSHSDGYMWLNPPYGREIKDWIKKCDEEAQKGAKVVALLPACTDTLWFHNHIYRKYETRFLKGRIKFKLNGEQMDAAPFPSMIVIFEKKIDPYLTAYPAGLKNPDSMGEFIFNKELDDK